MRLIRALYAFVLRTIGFAERRCGWCQKFLGWKYGPAFRKSFSAEEGFAVTHGICGPCDAVNFPAQQPVAVVVQKKPRRQYSSRKTLRRRTGGWSGAVACRRVA